MILNTIELQFDSSLSDVVVCWLLNIPATCECISGTDLLRQFYVLHVHHSVLQGYGKPGTCSHLVVELHEIAQLVMMVDYLREMTVKKSCQYG